MRTRGFSLVEVMVVLVILGLTVTFATLGFQRLESDRLEKQAEELSNWLQAVSDNAVLDGAVYGVWLDRDAQRLRTGYHHNNRWWEVDGETFVSPELEEDTDLLVGDGPGWRPFRVRDEGTGQRRPAMLFLPVGMTRPDRLLLRERGSDREIRIERNADGIFEWQPL